MKKLIVFVGMLFACITVIPMFILIFEAYDKGYSNSTLHQILDDISRFDLSWFEALDRMLRGNEDTNYHWFARIPLDKNPQFYL